MSTSTRHESGERFRESIRIANALHARLLDDPLFARDYERFTNWQLEHLLPFFDDLYAETGYSEAIDFIMNELSGISVSHRDRDLERAAPAFTRLLPQRALQLLADAADANARVLQVNIAICDALRVGDRLPDEITEVDYCIACRSASDLEVLLALVRDVCDLGRSLKSLVKVPMIGVTLAAMRAPARATGFAALHHFLEHGYTTFREIPDIRHFIAEIEHRMKQVFTMIYTTSLAELRASAPGTRRLDRPLPDG